MAIPQGFKTTGMTSHLDSDAIMSGEEKYPILGDLITEDQLAKIIAKCKGLKTSWNCIEKAEIVAKEIGGKVEVGSAYVWTGDFSSQYGFEFNPPYEFHAWVSYKGGFIDVALPGVIHTGLTSSDEVGPYLVDREPVVLASAWIPRWLEYNTY